MASQADEPNPIQKDLLDKIDHLDFDSYDFPLFETIDQSIDQSAQYGMCYELTRYMLSTS